MSLKHILKLKLKRPTRTAAAPLTLREAAELRGRLAAWEEDSNAPGMEAYDQP